VTAEFQLDYLWRGAFDGDLLDNDFQTFPFAVEQHFIGIRRIHFLDIHILLIGSDNGEPPSEPFVVPERNADKRRFASRYLSAVLSDVKKTMP